MGRKKTQGVPKLKMKSKRASKGKESAHNVVKNMFKTKVGAPSAKIRKKK